MSSHYHLGPAPPATSVARVCEVVCSAYGCEEEVLRAKRRHGNEARDAAVYLARYHARGRLAELGERFGGVSTPAVSLACKRVEEGMGRSKTLRTRIRDLGGS